MSATEVLTQARDRRVARAFAIGALTVVLAGAATVGLAAYLNLPTTGISNSSPTPGSAATNPAATPTPTASDRPTNPPSTGPNPPATGPIADAYGGVANWKALIWRPAEPAEFASSRPLTIRSVIRAGNGYIAVGWSGELGRGPAPGGEIWTSADGIHWVRVGSIDEKLADHSLFAVAAIPGGYAAWAFKTDRIFVSADGSAWQARDLPVGMALNWVGNAFVGLSAGQGPDELIQWDSDDGASWRSHVAAGLHPSFMPNMRMVIGTRFGLFLIRMLGHDGFSSFQSLDGGQTWQSFTLPNGLSAYSVIQGPAALFVGEPECGTNAVAACTGAIGTSPPLWKTTDGVTWRRVGTASFPEIGGYDGTFVADIATRGPFETWGSSCPTPLRYGAPIRLSSDAKSVQALKSYPADPQLLADPGFGCFGALAIGANGIVAVGTWDLTSADNSTFGTTNRVWFGQASDLAVAPALTFPPQPSPTPYINTDSPCLGGEGGDPGVVCVPYDLYPLLPPGSLKIDCPPAAPTVSPGARWQQVADTIWRLRSGDCVGTP